MISLHGVTLNYLISLNVIQCHTDAQAVFGATEALLQPKVVGRRKVKQLVLLSRVPLPRPKVPSVQVKQLVLHVEEYSDIEDFNITACKALFVK